MGKSIGLGARPSLELWEVREVDNWPRWLRWVLFAPAAIAAPLLWGFLSRLFMPSFIGRGLVYILFESAMMGGLFVGVGAWVAPARRPVAFILSAVLLVLCGSTLALYLANPYETSVTLAEALVSSGGLMAGGGYMAWQFVQRTDEQLREG
jgi:hypothetical protein